MDIKDFKLKLEQNKLNESFFIFVLKSDNEKFEKYYNDVPSSSIISDQYIKILSEKRHLTIKYIDSFNDIPDQSFIQDDNLYVIETDEWTTEETHENCVVVCRKCKFDDVIDIQPLVEWQVVDYALSKVKGLVKSDVENLIKRYTTSHGTNYRRFLKDIEKISVFNEGSQNIIYHNMLSNGDFDVATNFTIFDLTNAIMKRDINTISLILDKMKYIKDGSCKNDYYIDIEPLGLWTLLYRKFKMLLNIKTNSNCSYEEVGCKSDKQLWYIKTYESNYYSVDQITKILEILTNIEYMYKCESLPVDRQLIDYLICKVLEA